jgi:hypothetical protein
MEKARRTDKLPLTEPSTPYGEAIVTVGQRPNYVEGQIKLGQLANGQPPAAKVPSTNTEISIPGSNSSTSKPRSWGVMGGFWILAQAKQGLGLKTGVA